MIVGDRIAERLEQARSFGCETVDISKGDPKDQIEQILGVPEVDCAVDAVGFEARGHGDGRRRGGARHGAQLIMDLTRAAGKLGIPGLYVTGDPGRRRRRRQGGLAVDPDRPRLGEVPLVHHRPVPGDALPPRPDAAILNDRAQIAKAVNATVITLDEAPQGYQDFDSGVAEVRPQPERPDPGLRPAPARDVAPFGPYGSERRHAGARH